MKPACLASAYCYLVPKLTEEARTLGYALALHGSMARDLDIVAIPWTEDAAPAEELVAALEKATGGFSATHAKSADEPEPVEMPRLKPHGRRAWMIYLNGSAYIDLSIMPLSPCAARAVSSAASSRLDGGARLRPTPEAT